MFVILNDMALCVTVVLVLIFIHSLNEKRYQKNRVKTTRLGRIITNNVLEENIHNSLSRNCMWNGTTIHVIRLGPLMFLVIKSEIVFLHFYLKTISQRVCFSLGLLKPFLFKLKQPPPPHRTLDIYDIVNYYYDYDLRAINVQQHCLWVYSKTISLTLLQSSFVEEIFVHKTALSVCRTQLSEGISERFLSNRSNLLITFYRWNRHVF